MPVLKTILPAYLCSFRVCAKNKYLERNFKTIRRTDRQTNWKADKHTDNNFGLSRFLQMTLYPVMPGLQTFLSAYLCTFRVCAKDKILTKNCQIKRIRWTDRLTGQRQNIGEKKLRQSDEKLGRNFKSRWTDEMIKWHIFANVLHLDMRKKRFVFLKNYMWETMQIQIGRQQMHRVDQMRGLWQMSRIVYT